MSTLKIRKQKTADGDFVVTALEEITEDDAKAAKIELQKCAVALEAAVGADEEKKEEALNGPSENAQAANVPAPESANDPKYWERKEKEAGDPIQMENPHGGCATIAVFQALGSIPPRVWLLPTIRQLQNCTKYTNEWHMCMRIAQVLTDLCLGAQGVAQYEAQQLDEDDVRRKRSTTLLKMLPLFSVPNFEWSIYKGAFTVTVLARVRALFEAIDQVESRNVYKTAFLSQIKAMPHGHPTGAEVAGACVVPDCSDSPSTGVSFEYTRSLKDQIAEGFARKVAQTRCPCGGAHEVKTTYADVLIVQSMLKSQVHNPRFMDLNPAVSFYNESYWVDPWQQQVVDNEIELGGRKYTLRAAVVLVCLRTGLVCNPGKAPLARDCFHAAALIRRGDKFHVVDSDLSSARYHNVGLDRLVAGSHLFVYSTDESSLPRTVADDNVYTWEKLRKAYEQQDLAEEKLEEAQRAIAMLARENQALVNREAARRSRKRSAEETTRMEAWRLNSQNVWCRHVIHRLVRISGSRNFMVQFSPGVACDELPEMMQVSPGSEEFYPPIDLRQPPGDIQLYKVSQKEKSTHSKKCNGIGGEICLVNRGAKFKCNTCDDFYYCWECYLVFLVQIGEEARGRVKNVPEAACHDAFHKFDLDKPDPVHLFNPRDKSESTRPPRAQPQTELQREIFREQQREKAAARRAEQKSDDEKHGGPPQANGEVNGDQFSFPLDNRGNANFSQISGRSNSNNPMSSSVNTSNNAQSGPVRDPGQWYMHYLNMLPANITGNNDFMLNMLRMSLDEQHRARQNSPQAPPQQQPPQQQQQEQQPPPASSSSSSSS